MKTLRAFCLSCGMLLLVSGVSAAQSSTTGAIAGIARDATGAVLPGVTVEAASPALIEKVRSAVTDERGNYKVVDLRPGTYAVTFTLPGFSTFKREGIELTTGVTANVNGDLKVGALEETVTVTGGSPVVDVQNVRTQTVISQERLDSLPSNKSVAGFSALTLGATVGASQDVGGNRGEASGTFQISIHGSRGDDVKIMLDGMLANNNSATAGGQAMNYRMNVAAVQETSLETSGMTAEASTGGVQINYVPKDGGNDFKAYGVVSYANKSLQQSNLTDTLRARGVTSAGEIKRNDDYAVGLGGPLKRDRLWFYTAHRRWGTDEIQPGAFFNKSTNPFVYVPDPARPAYIHLKNRDHSMRVTWQVSPSNKITVSESVQSNINAYQGTNNLISPESTQYLLYYPQALTAVTWSHPASNRLLIEAGVGYMHNPKASPLQEGVTTDSIQVNDTGTGQRWGAFATTGSTAYSAKGQAGHQMNGRASAAYITGSHAMKVGLTFYQGWDHVDRYVTQSLSYTLRNGVPVSLTQYAMPLVYDNNMSSNGVYAQDQWTLGRFTVTGGVRADFFVGTVKPADLPAARFLPARHFDGVNNVPNWKDVSPRFGIAYDVFGNGRTAVKASLGRFVLGQGITLVEANNPQNTLALTAVRTWNDANLNFAPDCNLSPSVGANGECGALSNAKFGQPSPTQRYDEAFIRGFGVRPYNWQGSAILQQELRTGMALAVGYFRLSYGNFTVVQNAAVTASDFTSFCLATPTDSRLPSSGQPLCGLYDINPNRFGLTDNVITNASNFGDQTEVFNGVDVQLNARFGKGFFSGGVSMGRTVTDNCYLNSRPDVGVLTNPRNDDFCHVAPPLGALTQFKLNGAYPLPLGFQISGNLQNLGGAQNTATNTFTNAQVAPALGRNLAAGAAGTATFAVLKPQSKFENRLTQLDLRFTKSVKVQRLRVQAQFDVYNLFNVDTVLAANGTFGASWLRPTTVIGPRMMKLGAVVDF